MDRRFFLAGFGLSVYGSIFSEVAFGAGVPFCCFSWGSGWSGSRRGQTIRAKPTRVGGTSGIPEVIDSIKGVLDFDASIDVYVTESREQNAFATVARSRRMLVVDVDFLKDANRLGGSDWLAIQIIAHEIGHFIAGFDSPSHVNELNADYWSGLTMQRLGASREISAQAVTRYGDRYDTNTHPNKYNRARMVENGWDDGSQGFVDYSHCTDCE